MRQIDQLLTVSRNLGPAIGQTYAIVRALCDATTGLLTIAQTAIAARAGRTERTICSHLAVLDADGYIRRTPQYDPTTGWRTPDLITVIEVGDHLQTAARAATEAARKVLAALRAKKNALRFPWLAPTRNKLQRPISQRFKETALELKSGLAAQPMVYSSTLLNSPMVLRAAQ